MNYNWVQTFWNSLINMEAKDWIEIGLSLAIAIFAFLQWFISKKKRADDLFEMRYDLYKEIVKFIDDCLSSFDSPIESPIYVNLSDPAISNTQEYIIYPAAVKSFKNRVRWLFDEKLAIWLEKQLMNGSFSKCKHYKAKQIDYFWFPNEEFTKKFDKYLKLK